MLKPWRLGGCRQPIPSRAQWAGSRNQTERSVLIMCKALHHGTHPAARAGSWVAVTES